MPSGKEWSVTVHEGLGHARTLRVGQELMWTDVKGPEGVLNLPLLFLPIMLLSVNPSQFPHSFRIKIYP